MDLPDFIRNLHALDVPFPADIVTTHAMRSDRGLMVIFDVKQDVELAEHAHLGQWGTVLEGQLDLRIDGETRTYRPGDSYTIPSGAPHAAKVYAGSKVMDIFEEPDRYPLKG
tara:strand:- start:1374 stop:1709 length:336 start_codon:yes stop_codon:yes gene_type:complete